MQLNLSDREMRLELQGHVHFISKVLSRHFPSLSAKHSAQSKNFPHYFWIITIAIITMPTEEVVNSKQCLLGREL